ncbi:hypothetical protein AB0K60_31480 [Thermopolyspora sp. NPDC052614]|uniref:hypothetical protein n=1 Tax=Thermopolyspora sp. NPDC052614 TaxID=3155682 RepID=UPI0034126D25
MTHSPTVPPGAQEPAAHGASGAWRPDGPGAPAAGPEVLDRHSPEPAPGPDATGAGDASRTGGSGRRMLRAIGNAIMALAILALATYLDTEVLNQDELDAHLTSHARLGEVAATGRFSARLDRVEFARSIEMRTTRVNAATGQEEVTRSTRLGTEHIFVIASVSATAPKEPIQLTVAGLETPEEVFYAQTDRVDKRFTMAGVYVQPGWWAKGVFVFEVPVKALAGARATLSAQSTNGIYDTIYPQRYDQLLPEVALDLGLEEAEVKSAVAGAKNVYELKAPE